MDPSVPPPSYDEVIMGFTTAYSSTNEPIRIQELRSPIDHRSQQIQRSILQQRQIQQPFLQQQRHITHENIPIHALNQVHSRQPEQFQVIRRRLNGNSLGRKSESYQCPYCGNYIQTKITAVINETTHVLAFMLCFLGCFLCSCIPYCINTCKDIKHFCPDCDSFLGLNDVTEVTENR